MEQQRKLYEQGQILMKYNRYDDALSRFEWALEYATTDAVSAETWFRIGCCRSEIAKQKIENSEETLDVHEESEIYEAAIQAYKKAIELQKNHVDARKSLASLFYDFGERESENAREEEEGPYSYIRAIDWFKQAVKVCPGMTDVYNQIAQTCAYWMDDAIFETQQDYAYSPSDISMRINEAGEALIEAHQNLIQIRPDDFNTYYALGNAHRRWVDINIMTSEYLNNHCGYPDRDEIEAMKQGKDPNIRENLEEAIEAYRGAVGIKPDYAVAYRKLAESYQWIGQLEEAIQALKQAIVHGNKEHSNLAKTYHKLGKKNSDNREYTTAIEYYHNAILADSKYVEVYYDLAFAHDEAGDFELAIVWYQRVRSFYNYPSDLFRLYPDLLYRLGLACHKCSHYQDAVDAYQEAIYHQTAFEPLESPEWWDDVFKYKEAASRHEPL